MKTWITKKLLRDPWASNSLRVQDLLGETAETLGTMLQIFWRNYIREFVPTLFLCAYANVNKSLLELNLAKNSIQIQYHRATSMISWRNLISGLLEIFRNASKALQVFNSVILAVHSTILLVSFSGAGPPFSQLYLDSIKESQICRESYYG